MWFQWHHNYAEVLDYLNFSICYFFFHYEQTWSNLATKTNVFVGWHKIKGIPSAAEGINSCCKLVHHSSPRNLPFSSHHWVRTTATNPHSSKNWTLLCLIINHCCCRAVLQLKICSSRPFIVLSVSIKRWMSTCFVFFAVSQMVEILS